jgi:hypothetical protein
MASPNQHRAPPEQNEALAGCAGGLQRVDYFAGMVLGVDDFSAEQDYLRQRLNRRNRLLHGSGVVAGLEVTVTTSGKDAAVTIAPGLAFDPTGNEIGVESPSVLALPASGTSLLVLLAYREQSCRFAPALTNSPAQAEDAPSLAHATRIVETFAATLAAGPAVGAVAIARLRRVRGRWRLDPVFKAARVRR